MADSAIPKIKTGELFHAVPSTPTAIVRWGSTIGYFVPQDWTFSATSPSGTLVSTAVSTPTFGVIEVAQSGDDPELLAYAQGLLDGSIKPPRASTAAEEAQIERLQPAADAIDRAFAKAGIDLFPSGGVDSAETPVGSSEPPERAPVEDVSSPRRSPSTTQRGGRPGRTRLAGRGTREPRATRAERQTVDRSAAAHPAQDEPPAKLSAPRADPAKGPGRGEGPTVDAAAARQSHRRASTRRPGRSQRVRVSPGPKRHRGTPVSPAEASDVAGADPLDGIYQPEARLAEADRLGGTAPSLPQRPSRSAVPADRVSGAAGNSGPVEGASNDAKREALLKAQRDRQRSIDAVLNSIQTKRQR